MMHPFRTDLFKECHECPKRYPGCSATCPDYIRDKAESDRRAQAERKAKETNSAIKAVQYHSLRKNRKEKER